MSRLLLAHAFVLMLASPFVPLTSPGTALAVLGLGSVLAGVAHAATTGLRPLPQFQWLAALGLTGLSMLVQWMPMAVVAGEVTDLPEALEGLVLTGMSLAVIPTAFLGWPLARAGFGIGCFLTAREAERPLDLDDVFR